MKTFNEFVNESIIEDVINEAKAGTVVSKGGSDYFLSDMGTYVKVTAKFTDDDKANAYLAKNKKEGAIGMGVRGKTVYIGDMKDVGISIKKFNKQP